eukprot:CAMPEP_0183377906 /NCGR_PEP_ID=MMETSP0164_2-20130417/124258_1 /TAXON_ID=221442 /ORGANISM="Coccolithus pelagicus ssp braarudi, Strain PLY182g" /LENGTH=83 /DNA_ID=CAMNT_0025555417 /DNA_START=752 /DNA_END=1000 /DNA_ORIENTATION=-
MTVDCIRAHLALPGCAGVPGIASRMQAPMSAHRTQDYVAACGVVVGSGDPLASSTAAGNPRAQQEDRYILPRRGVMRHKRPSW